MVKTYKDLYAYASEPLEALLMADLEARELVALAARQCGSRIKAGELRIFWEQNAPEGTPEALTALLERRLAGEPLAYLLGEWDFYGLTLKVDRRVLVPRPDTETLVETALKKLPTDVPLHFLDLCTGSGCIGLALLHKNADWTAMLADLSEDALDVARENMWRLGMSSRAQVRILDALEEPPEDLPLFDAIVSNPPYVSADEMLALDVEVTAFEPNDALYGGSDGLNFYRAIGRQYKNVLRPGGWLLVEIGAYQAAEVEHIFEDCGYTEIERVQDLAGRDRVVCARRPA